ncbi:MAG: hypothetical protein QFY14_00560 [Candidatus Phytoplasma pruni]|nr:hypothetical protein [Candidatus Phytoplasma pruni]
MPFNKVISIIEFNMKEAKMSNDKNKSEILMQKVVKSAIINIVMTTLVLVFFCIMKL